MKNEVKVLVVFELLDDDEKNYYIEHFKKMMGRLRYYKKHRSINELYKLIDHLNDLADMLNTETRYEYDSETDVIISKNSLIRLEGKLD